MKRSRRHASARLLALAAMITIASTLWRSPPVAASDSAAAPPPVAVDARLAEEGGDAKLTFDLSSPVEARAFSMADPDRIIIDVPQVNFQIDPAVGRAPQGKPLGPLVKSFRFGLFGPGKSRIVIDLNAPARITRVATQPIANGAEPARLQIELSHCERAAFLRDVGESGQGAAASEAVQTPKDTASAAGGLPVVVLDPGHGGVDSGAIGPGGAIEKTIVYDFTRALAQKLEASGRYHVLLTREGDQFVSLGDRVKIARDANAALLISIHADMLQSAADVSGATVYTVADRASDAEAARIAEHENAADKAAGVEQPEDAQGVADILFDLKRRETRAYAHIFSRNVVDEWRGAARLNHNPERSAGFVVLKAPDFPSVLVEIGYLSSPQDVKSLTSPEWREKAASALATAVDKFFEPRSESAHKPSRAEANANAPNLPAKGAH